MVEGHRRVKARQQQPDAQGKPAQGREGGGDQRVHAAVPRHLQEGRKGGWQQQTYRQPVCQDAHPALIQVHGKAVRPLGV